MARLDEKHIRVAGKIHAELQYSSSVSITHDGWTSISTKSYNTVTVHFISPDWQLKTAVLETQKVHGTHTSESIADRLLAVKAKWQIPQPIAVTDNAAIEVKAFKLLEWQHFGCFGHRINRVVRIALTVNEVSCILAKWRKLVTFLHCSSCVTDFFKEKQMLLLPEKPWHMLIQDVPTRWNPKYAMLERL